MRMTTPLVAWIDVLTPAEREARASCTAARRMLRRVWGKELRSCLNPDAAPDGEG